MKQKRTFEGTQYRGIVKWFNDDKGFGFLTDLSGKDHFVHQKNIQVNGHRTLAKGQEVLFYVEVFDKTGREHAVGVTPAE